VFTRALHWSLPWARPIQSIPPHPISPRSISILSSHLRHIRLSGLLSSDFPTINLHAFVFSPLLLHALPIYFFTFTIERNMICFKKILTYCWAAMTCECRTDCSGVMKTLALSDKGREYSGQLCISLRLERRICSWNINHKSDVIKRREQW
jgi:hypothetical protein